MPQTGRTMLTPGAPSGGACTTCRGRRQRRIAITMLARWMTVARTTKPPASQIACVIATKLCHGAP